jgi:serine-type D-Ala-D-Ala carboxypeptidase/endopeptidase (penicillin-binding protein 4)
MRRLTFALSAFLAFGPPAIADVLGPVAALPKAVVLGAKYGLGADNFGYLVVDVEDGTVLDELNADKPFMPASVAKVPTTAAALEILGPDHHFVTSVLIDGEVVDGVANGSLTLRGGGDPLLTGDHIQILAKEIAKSGIKKVEGAFQYDTTYLSEVPQINALQPEAAGYNPGVSALSVNFNRVRMTWRNGDGGPSAAATAVSDNVTLPVGAIGFAPAEDALPGPFARASQRAMDEWLLSPQLSESGEDWLPIANPALVAAEMLRLLAQKEGVELPEPTPGTASPDAREIARYESPSLEQVIRIVLRHSNNMAAELVGLAATRAITGEPLSLEASAKLLSDYWRQKIPDVDWDGFFLENQSGLSAKSRATPRQLVAILEHAAQSRADENFYDLLRAASWKAPNGKTVRIRAKTGTIAYGRGLAGYIDAANGHRLAFAVFFNDFERRAALDATFDPRVETRDPEWRPWRGRALKLEEMLINSWATGS